MPNSMQQDHSGQNDWTRLKTRFKAVAQPLWEKFREQVLHTKIEIAIGAVLFTGVTLAIGVHKNRHKEHFRAVAFSEREATERRLRNSGATLTGTTNFTTLVNDYVMKINEANNLGYQWGTGHKEFGIQLERKHARDMRVHSTLLEINTQMPEAVRQMRQSVGILLDAVRDLPPLIKALDKTWKDTHVDHYRTVYYTTTDSKGKTVRRSRRVYDYTVHDYDFDKRQGLIAAQLLRSFATKYPHLKISDTIMHATETNADNEWAIRESMEDKDKARAMTADDYLAVTNTYATGATLTRNQPEIINRHQQLEGMTPVWETAVHKAKNAHYRTGSRYDAGPAEFRIVEKALDDGVVLKDLIQQIKDGVDYAEKTVPELTKLVGKYVDAALHGGEGDLDDMRAEILDKTSTLYEKNFNNGFEMRPFDWGNVALWGLLGAVAGTAAGAGVDYLIDKRQARRRREDENDFLSRFRRR